MSEASQPRAVTGPLAVVLLVGFAMIAAIGIMTLGLPSLDPLTKPAADEVDVTLRVNTSGPGQAVVVRHAGGTNLTRPATQWGLKVVYRTNGVLAERWWEPPIRRNDTVRIRAVDPNTTVRVLWYGPRGRPAVINVTTVPG